MFGTPGYPFLRFLFRYKESGSTKRFERRSEFTMQPETGFDPLKWLAPCQRRNTSATNVSPPSLLPSFRFFNGRAISGGLLILIVASPDPPLPPPPPPPVNTSFLSLDEAWWVDDLDGVASNWSLFKIAPRYITNSCLHRSCQFRVSSFEGFKLF